MSSYTFCQVSLQENISIIEKLQQLKSFIKIKIYIICPNHQLKNLKKV